MSFFKTASGPAPIPIEDGQHILRAPKPSDYLAWKEVREASREFLEPFEPLWPTNDLSRLGFRRRLKRYEYEYRNKTGETYFLVNAQDDLPIGGISISHIRYGVAKNCIIGYWMAHEHAGKGHMKRAVAAISHYIFKKLKLCRIEAACLPENIRSSRLLERAGFTQEGYLRQYLEINGTRQDHVLFSLLFDD